MTQLKAGLDLSAVVALGLGTAVGVAIFSVVAPAAALAGPGMLLAVVLAALPMFIIAVNYAFLGSALPASGASYEWPVVSYIRVSALPLRGCALRAVPVQW